MRLAWVLTRGGGGGAAAYATKAHDVAPYIRGRTSVLVCDLPVAAGNLLVDLRRGECADKQDNKPAESSSTFPIDEFSPGSVPLFLLSLSLFLQMCAKTAPAARLATDLSCTTANCGAED
jgi:hypothetical protein